MARRSKTDDPKKLISGLADTLSAYAQGFDRRQLKDRVLGLVDAHYLLRDLGSSLMPDAPKAARQRILAYFRANIGQVVSGDELMVISGISEYARRIRELRVEYGWPIMSGNTVTEDEDAPNLRMKPDEYLMVRDTADENAAERWKLASTIRKDKDTGVREKLLKFFKANIGKVVSNEELKYLAGDNSEWARRVRELRTEHGWAVVTQNTGRPDLKVGEYMLEHGVQAEPHDRQIPDEVRAEVLTRDKFACVTCGWTQDKAVKGDPRTRLELHHVQMHSKGGANDAKNLKTLCNVCHDVEHRKKKA